MVVIFEITGTRFLTLKAGHSICKEESMQEPCSLMERAYKCPQDCLCVHIHICFPSGCLLSNDTLVATNAQHLDLHFYHPLAEARTLEIRGQIWAGTGKADEEAVRAEQ